MEYFGEGEFGVNKSILVATQSDITNRSRLRRELSRLEKLSRPLSLLCLDSAAL